MFPLKSSIFNWAGRVSRPVRAGAVLCAAAVAISAQAQTTVSTVPVGFVSGSIQPSPDGVNPGYTVISIPVYKPAVFAGAITSVDSSTAFSCTSGTWTTNQFSGTASPTFAQIMTGSSTGRYFLITANTATQLTVNTGGLNLTQMLAVGDTFQVIPANTFVSLFGISGTSAVPFVTGATADVADNLDLWNTTTSAWDQYYNNGTHWYKASSIKVQDNTVIYPDQAIFVSRTGTAPLTLPFMGVVPSTAEVTNLPGPNYAMMSVRFPTDTTVLGLGIQALPGWQSGATADAAGDNLYIWDNVTVAWDQYFYNGTHWYKSSSIKSQDATVVPAGTGVFVSRASTASGTAASLVQALPYSTN